MFRSIVFSIVYVGFVASAYTAPNQCDSATDYTSWADCARRQAISSDARLNLVYKKLIDKLRGNVDAINHIRDAQRRWIAFRDAQCELEGLPSVGSSAHSTTVSGCFESMAIQRIDALFRMLTCKEDNVSCLKPANPNVGSGTPRSDLTAQPQSTMPSGIPFESPDIIEKLKVSGVWFPEETKPLIGLSGSANFVFSNVETHETFRVDVDGIALLPEDFWKSKRVSDAEGLDASTLADRLKTYGILKISLSPETRAKIITCSSDIQRSADAHSQGDQCMQFGSAPVDIQDIDFDG